MFRTGFFLLVGVVALGALYEGVLKWDSAYGSRLTEREPELPPAEAPLIELLSQPANAIRVTDPGVATIGLQTIEVEPAPPPEPLRLPGSLLLDPNRLVRIHARFSGELASLGSVEVEAKVGGVPASDARSLRFGDRVKKGQILAVVWSKDIGEKKSELVDALSKAEIDNTLLKRLEQVERGVVPERTIQEAKRNYEADLIAITKAERTLRSWRLTDDDIDEVRREAKRIQKREPSDPQADRTWAETEVRSPIDGIVVEKNFNVGDIIDPTQDLFKIADLARVQVLANAYEEDLPLLRSLRPEQRKWNVDLKSDPNDDPVQGTFDIIGNIIDPAQHAGAVMGWLDNPDGRLSIGEFITATIQLPADPNTVTVPTSALIEDGSSAKVFVAIDRQRNELACRKVAVVRRGRQRIYVRSEPSAAEKEQGAQPLKPGEYVVQSGVLELAAEMKTLQAAAREQVTQDVRGAVPLTAGK